MQGTRYLCVLYVATAGQQGARLGSDEEEVVLLVYVVIDVAANKVVGAQQYIVKPMMVEHAETVLSEHILAHSELTEEIVNEKGVSLGEALIQFDDYVRSLSIDPCSQHFCLVTDGQFPLRQCLHPESCSKNIDLAPYYNAFHDLRKDFSAFYSAPVVNSIKEMINYISMTFDTENEFYVKEAKDMVNIVHRLIADGYCFDNPETVELRLEPGICSKNEEVDNNCVVRARGLPWQSSDQDIAKFFRGLNVAKGGVALCLSLQGRRNGEALVRFVNQEHRDMALGRHKHHLATRYIEIYKATGPEFVAVAGGNNSEAEAFLSRGAQVIIRMRGLPYECTAKQVLEFFEAGENSCQVMDGEDGVLFVKKPDKRATGDAFVLFAHDEDGVKAISKHRELIGSRYIELFRSTTAEVQQVLNRSMDPKTYESVSAPSLPIPMLSQQFVTTGTRRDCIRLRGLPYEAQVENILEFLGDRAKSIVFQGVHMVFNAQGQPSGEAFIQMDSEMSAAMAAQQKHHRYMIFGKKQRYIEVFQCSGEDMNLVIAGGIPTGGPVSPAKAAAAATTLLSPGTLAYPPPGPPHNPHPGHAAHAHPHAGTGVLGHPPHASLQIPPSPVLAWDQSLFPGGPGLPGVASAQQHMLVQAQMQQALRQQQAQQENLWLNTLAAAQQAQQQQLAAALAAVNVSGAKGWDGSLGGSLGAAHAAHAAHAAQSVGSQRALIPISSSASPATSSGNASFSLANSNSLPQSVSSKSMAMPMSYYPGAGVGSPQSVYLFNATQASQAARMPQYHPKVPPPNASVHGSASSNAAQSPLSPLVQSPAGSNAALMAGMGSMGTMGMKRSWENAFPTDNGQLPLKRQWQSSQAPQASAAALSYMQSALPPYQAQFYPTM